MRPHEEARFVPHQNVIIGNTALYGATDVATMQSLPQGDTFCATSV